VGPPTARPSAPALAPGVVLAIVSLPTPPSRVGRAPGTRSRRRSPRALAAPPRASPPPQAFRATAPHLSPGAKPTRPAPRAPSSRKHARTCSTGTQTGMLAGLPASATCVQGFDDSRYSAIHTTYRSWLRSSSLREPRHPPLRVVISSRRSHALRRANHRRPFGLSSQALAC
jgi:hypothetical protein